MTQRKKILLNAYAISPNKGSEFSIGWTTVNLLSQKYAVYVLYGTSGNTMGDTKEIEQLDKNGYNENIKFIKVNPGFFARNLNWFNTNLKLGFFFSFALYFYQLEVYKTAKKLNKEIKFDIVHQLNPIGFREPGFLWKLNLPFVLGPISGTYILPKALINWSVRKNAINIVIRNFVKWFYLSYSSRIKKAVRKSDVVITATSADAENITKYYQKRAYVLPEHFVNTELVEIPYNYEKTLKLIWIGSVDARKNLNLLIDVLEGLKHYNWTLDVIGEGGLRSKLEKKTQSINLQEKISFKGHIPRTQVIKLTQSAHLHIMTTLSDATTSVLFEASSNQVPTMSLNHCGMADVISEKCGFLIPLDVKNYDELVLRFRGELENILKNPEILVNKRSHIFNRLERYTAKSRLKDIENFYDEAISNFNLKNNNV